MLLSADGALEAAPAMGAADIILDLVSTGVTLRENNLKMIEDGDILAVRRCPPVLCGCFELFIEMSDVLPTVLLREPSRTKPHASLVQLKDGTRARAFMQAGRVSTQYCHHRGDEGTLSFSRQKRAERGGARGQPAQPPGTPRLAAGSA